MKQKEEVILKKDGRLLSLEYGDKTTKFDFKDKKFISFTGREIKTSTLRSQLSNKKLNKEKSDKKYVKLFDFISEDATNNWRALSNLGTIVSELPNYVTEEKYLSQGFIVKGKLHKPQEDRLSKIPKNIKKLLKSRGLCIENISLVDSKEAQSFVLFMDEYAESDEDFNFFCGFIWRYSWGISPTKEAFIDLVTLHNYKIKSLCKYVLNLYNYEAMDYNNVMEYLRDYLQMSTLMGATKINKYPKNLHTTHDIVIRNFNDFKLLRDDTIWNNLVNTDLEYSSGDYCIVYPKSYKDVQAEGASLHHCVASYVDRVFDRKCDIVFLRLADKPEESLVTVEVSRGVICQYRGSFNRALAEDEMDFLIKYAKNKNLKID